MKIPVIQTPRLTLRSFALADLDPLYAIVSDPDVVRYFPRADPWPLDVVQRTLNDHWRHWEEHGYGWWAVERRQNGELLGWCGLCFLDETAETEVKYLLKRSHWGRGLATEGARRSIQYAFTELDLDMIVGLVHPENIASQRVLEKSGLIFGNRATYFGLELLRYTIARRRWLSTGETYA